MARNIPYEENHREVNDVLEKKCNIHDIYTPDENPWLPCTDEYFYKTKNKTDCLSPWCKQCTIKKSGKWQNENKEQAYENIYRFKKTPKWHEYNYNYGQGRKGEIKQYKKEHPEKTKQYNKNHSRKKHDISKEELDDLYTYTKFSCMYCGITEEESLKTYKQHLHKDHAYNDGSNGIENCVLACKRCNSLKHTKDWDEWFIPTNKLFNQDRYDKIKNWLNLFIKV